MPKKSAIAYCSIDPPYPLKAYVAMVLCTDADGFKVILPLSSLQKDFADIAGAMKDLRKNIEKEGGSISIPDRCFVLPVTFLRRYPLKKEFWQKPVHSYTSAQRMSAFFRVMEKPLLYSLIVTPSLMKKKWWCMAALPVVNSAADVTIEQFMQTSDWPVSEEAKSAAIYTFSTLIIYNWVERWEEDMKNSLPDISQCN